MVGKLGKLPMDKVCYGHLKKILSYYLQHGANALEIMAVSILNSAAIGRLLELTSAV